MWKRLVTVAAFGLLTSCGGSEKDSEPSSQDGPATVDQSMKDVGYLLDFENDQPCEKSEVEDAMSSIFRYNLNSITLEGYGKFNVEREIFKTDDGAEYVSYFIPLTGRWHDSGLHILGLIATTCSYACGYRDVSYHFQEDAYTLLNSLKRLNIKRMKLMNVSKELDLGSPDSEGGPYFDIARMKDRSNGDMYKKTKFGRMMMESSGSVMSCTVSI